MRVAVAREALYGIEVTTLLRVDGTKVTTTIFDSSTAVRAKHQQPLHEANYIILLLRAVQT